MIGTEELHARPGAGQTASPCCGRPPTEFPQYDRIAPTDALVTCGRLSETDILLLSGQPVVLDPRTAEVVYAMATTVVTLSAGAASLETAYEKVQSAILEVLPTDRPLTSWTTALMVRVTSRAQQLVVQAAPGTPT